MHEVTGTPITPLQGPPDRLGPHAAFFFRQLTPPIILPLLVIGIGARIYIGEWSIWDLVIPAVLISVQSGSEWVLHKYVLHFGPRKMFGREVDIHPCQAHRRHHENPNDATTVFIGPIGTVVFLIGLVIIAFVVLRTSPLFLTGVCTGLAIMLVYEWTHFLLHTAYVPRHRYYREVQRLHSYHHFRNEWYWMGITGHLFDKILRTNPDPEDVPLTELSITAQKACGMAET